MGIMWDELWGAGMRVGGELFCANVANWATQTGLAGPSFSRFGGNAWSPWTYAVTGLGGWMLGRFVIGNFNRNAGLNFQRGVADTIIRKLLWTELIVRNPAVDRWLGATPVQYDANGNVWYTQPDGSQDAMMGNGTLVPEDALDGYGQLVSADALDGYGQLVQQRAYDGYGHATVTTPAQTQHAKYHGAQFNSLFHAAYQRAY